MTFHAASIPGLELETIACPLCGQSALDRIVSTRDFFCGLPGEYHFDRCRGCGHVFMNPRPTPATNHLCYPTAYGPHQTADASGGADAPVADSGAGRPWYARAPFRWVPGLRAFYYWLITQHEQIIPAVEVSSPRALEIGCAVGGFLHRLEHAGWQTQGLEPGARAAARARAAGLQVEQGTVENAALPAEAFDGVFAWMVLEHLHDPRTALRNIRYTLRPGGWFCFSVPNYGCWEKNVFGRYWLGYDVPRHLHQFTPARLRRLLAESGFHSVQLIHQRNFRFVYGSFATWRLARNPDSRLGRRLMQWYDQTAPLWFDLLTAPPAHVLALLRQGGRLTCVARRSEEGPTVTDAPTAAPPDGD